MEIEALDESADQLRAAVAAQADALNPSLADLADWGRALTELTDRPGTAAQVLAAQPGATTTTPATPPLRDDEGLDPIARIDDAIVHLHDAYTA